MSLEELVVELARSFKEDPRNKVLVQEQLLLASVAEETGNDISAEKLRTIISAFQAGELDEESEALYDGAVYACGMAARHCFNDDPEDDIDYIIDWLEQEDGSYVAEVRQN